MEDNNYDYKKEIIESRTGCLGASDGAMMCRVDKNGQVSPADKERLAIVKGLYTKEDITTEAMRYGDLIEMSIFNSLKSQDNTWGSNKKIISQKHKKKNVSLICHPDFIHQNDIQKKLQVYECKATIKSADETLEFYMPQIYIEYELCKEFAQSLYGEKGRVEMYLCHYDTSGGMTDANGQFIFDPNKVTVKRVNIRRPPFNISRSLDIINDTLETMTEYHKEVVEFDYLPEVVQKRFSNVAECLAKIEQLNATVDKFKADIYDTMVKQDIKGIKNDYFTLSRIDPSESNQFDSKRFGQEHKTLYRQYLKKVQRSGSAKIMLKKPKDDAAKKEILDADFAVIK